MNRDRYRLVYSRARDQWMAVAELASGTGVGSVESSTRSRRRRAALSGLIVASFTLSPAVWPAAWAQPLPQGGMVVGGQAQITQGAPNQLTITQQSSRSVIDWRSFSIGSGHSVQFVQPGASAQTLNRVTGTDASQIQGLLSANGQVFLVNPNGIVFGQGAVVDVGGLIATTRDIPNAAFMAGCQSLALTPIGNSSGIVTNDGTIRAIRGYVVLQGAQVRNSGSIVADGGTIALAAGDRATVALSNGQLVSVQLDAAAADALVQSSGLIQAKGGQVLLTSRSANAVLGNAINLTGVIDVSAPATSSAAQASMASLPAAETAAQTASPAGGRVTIDGGEAGITQLAGARIDASSTTGTGGAITVTGERVALIEGTRIDARGATAGGSVKIGGGWQGNDAQVRNARMTVLDESSRIDASATDRGRGGSVVLWSNEYTGFYGNVAATGGPNGGDGGSVETSSHDNLQAFGRVNASAPNGQAGHWLLDPTNVTISSAANTNATVSGGLWTVTNATATISNASINADLNAGTSVTVTTTSTGTGTGHLNVNADIVKTAGPNASLTLLAEGNLTLNANLTSTSNALNVSLSTPRTLTFGNTTIDLNGGALTANGGSASGTAYGVEFKGNSVFAGDHDTALIHGTSGTAIGTRLSTGAIVHSGNGSLNITGASNSSSGMTLSSSIMGVVQNGSGILSIGGVSDTNYGVLICGTQIVQTGNGMLHINGVSNAACGTLALLSATFNQTGSGVLSVTGQSNTSFGSGFSASTLRQSGSGQLLISGTSNSSYGVNLYAGSALDQSGNGILRITGTSNPSRGVAISAASISQSGSGQLQIAGSSNTSLGIQANTTNFNQTGSGNLSFIGSSNLNAGMQFSAGSQFVQSGNGTLSIAGVSNTACGTFFSGATVTQSGDGVLRIDGVSNTSGGTSFSGTAVNQTGAGQLLVSGTSNGGRGIYGTGTTVSQTGSGNMAFRGESNLLTAAQFSSNSSIAQNGSGTLSISGVSNGSIGTWTDAVITQAGDGTLRIDGAAVGDYGTWITAASISQTGSGLMAISGTSKDHWGTTLSASTINQTGSGNLTISGTADSWAGTNLRLAPQITQTGSGSLKISGISNTNNGVTTDAGASIIQAGNGSLWIDGTSNTAYGVSASATIAQSGDGLFRIDGASDTSFGTRLSTATISQSGSGLFLISGTSDGRTGLYGTTTAISQTGSGNLSFSGVGNIGRGTQFNSNSSIVQNGSGMLSISGLSNTNHGVTTDADISISQAGNGSLWIDGTSNTSYGVYVATSATIVQSGGGSLAISGQSTSGTGITVSANSSVVQSGGGSLSIEGNSAGSVGLLVSSSRMLQSGPGSFAIRGTSIDAQGVLIQGGNVTVGNASFVSAGGGINASVPLNVGGLLVLDASGPNADVVAVNPANDISGTVTVAQGRNVSLVNSGALSLGAVNASGNISVFTQAGDLVINGDIASSAGNVTLVAGVIGPNGTATPDPHGDVRRGSGQSISVGPGRTVVIYSGNPDTIGPSGLGSLVAATSDGSTGVNKYYATNIIAGPGTGRVDPASPLNVFYRVQPTVTLSSSDAAKVYGADDPDFQWTASGLVDGDTAASLGLSGHLGRISGEGVGNHALTLGNMAIGPGTGQSYGLSVQGNFSITPAGMSVTAQDATKIYGSDDPTLTYTTSGAINRIVQSYDPSGARIGITVDDSSLALVSGNLGRNAGEGVGSHPIFGVTFASTNPNYQIASVTNASLAITPASAQVILDDQSKTAGQPDPTFTYTVSGAIDRMVQSVGPDGLRHGVAIRDDAASLTGGTPSRSPGESPGAYPIDSGSLHLVNSNYSLSGTPIAPATLTIVAAPVVPTPPTTPTEPDAPSLPQEPQQPLQPGTPDGTGSSLQRLSGALGFMLPIARLGWPGGVDSVATSRSDPLEYDAWRAVNPPLAESSATSAQAAAWTQALPSGANVIRLPIVVASPSAAAPSISDPYRETDRNTEGPRVVGPTASPVAMLQLHTDVLFQFGRSDVEGMLPAARADLDRFIDRLAAQGLAIDTLSIDGHADRLGSERANQRISQRRAQTVMRYLRQRGMTARMGIQAHGSSEPLARCDGHTGSALIACLQPDRRASVQAR